MPNLLCAAQACKHLSCQFDWVLLAAPAWTMLCLLSLMHASVMHCAVQSLILHFVYFNFSSDATRLACRPWSHMKDFMQHLCCGVVAENQCWGQIAVCSDGRRGNHNNADQEDAGDGPRGQRHCPQRVQTLCVAHNAHRQCQTEPPLVAEAADQDGEARATGAQRN